MGFFLSFFFLSFFLILVYWCNSYRSSAFAHHSATAPKQKDHRSIRLHPQSNLESILNTFADDTSLSLPESLGGDSLEQAGQPSRLFAVPESEVSNLDLPSHYHFFELVGMSEQALRNLLLSHGIHVRDCLDKSSLLRKARDSDLISPKQLE